MTDDEWEMIDQKARVMHEAIKAGMEQLTKGLTPEQDDALRVKLTEEVRFW